MFFWLSQKAEPYSQSKDPNAKGLALNLENEKCQSHDNSFREYACVFCVLQISLE